MSEIPTHCPGLADPRCKGVCTTSNEDGLIMDPDCFRNPLPYKGVEERAADGEPYFRIDGVSLEDADGKVIYKEYRKTPLGDNIIANGGTLHYTFVTDGTGQ